MSITYDDYLVNWMREVRRLYAALGHPLRECGEVQLTHGARGENVLEVEWLASVGAFRGVGETPTSAMYQLCVQLRTEVQARVVQRRQELDALAAVPGVVHWTPNTGGSPAPTGDQG